MQAEVDLKISAFKIAFCALQPALITSDKDDFSRSLDNG